MVDIDSPYTGGGEWLRGNLHAHSTASDGDRTPERVVADYAARGYDFLALSDHDTLVDPAEYRDATGMVLLPAVEVTANGPHTLHVGAERAVDPAADRQAVVDAIDEGFAVPAHPNWKESFAHWPRDELERVEGYAGIELYNAVMREHPGAATATGRWDRLLSAGRRVWGFANDDAHKPWEVGRAWNVVRAEERTPGAVLDALAAGRFYASTGVTVRRVDVAGDTVVVETDDADRIDFVSDYGRVQRTVEGSVGRCRVPEHLVHGEASYVRAACRGAGGATAWTQPG
ncbi:MAG: CehA/McbA family metallohydrolase [Halobacteriaceae archaeon]